MKRIASILTMAAIMVASCCSCLPMRNMDRTPPPPRRHAEPPHRHNAPPPPGHNKPGGHNDRPQPNHRPDHPPR